VSQENKASECKLILNPTDGSLVSERASLHAIQLAQLTGAELLIMHVVETSSAWYTGTLYQQVVDQLRDSDSLVVLEHRVAGTLPTRIQIP
jgi:nucleotide-binding universal stress UspA family protein